MQPRLPPRRQSNNNMSNNSTLIQRMGFQDPDRKDEKHDWACQFLSQEDTAYDLVSPFVERRIEKWASERIRTPIEPDFSLNDSASFEVPVNKVLYNWKQQPTGLMLVGFIDLVIEIVLAVSWSVDFSDVELATYDHDWDECKRRAEEWDPNSPKSRFRFEVSYSRQYAIEVKTGKIKPGDVLRQVKTYQEAQPESTAIWVLAHTKPIHKHDAGMLAKEGVHTYCLGEDFEAYCKDRAT